MEAPPKSHETSTETLWKLRSLTEAPWESHPKDFRENPRKPVGSWKPHGNPTGNPRTSTEAPWGFHSWNPGIPMDVLWDFQSPSPKFHGSPMELGSPMKIPWDSHEKPIGSPWKPHEASTEVLWELGSLTEGPWVPRGASAHGRLGVPWSSHGTPTEAPRVIHGNNTEAPMGLPRRYCNYLKASWDFHGSTAINSMEAPCKPHGTSTEALWELRRPTEAPCEFWWSLQTPGLPWKSPGTPTEIPCEGFPRKFAETMEAPWASVHGSLKFPWKSRGTPDLPYESPMGVPRQSHGRPRGPSTQAP